MAVQDDPRDRRAAIRDRGYPAAPDTPGHLLSLALSSATRTACPAGQ